MRKPLLLFVVALLALTVTAAASAARTLPAEPLQAGEWWLADVGADQVEPPGPGIPVTIVDSGLDLTHPEFAGRPNVTALNTQTVDRNDDEGHGTGVASIVGAPANGIGLLGVYPQAVLRSWDASPNGEIDDFAAIQGILAAARSCPGVINLSWGGPEVDTDLNDAISVAVRSGCLVVAASGNDRREGSPLMYPAILPHVLTIAATNERDQVTSFSSASHSVDLAAPGQRMPIAVPLTIDRSGYDELASGTSFSSPLVAGAAAWIWTARGGLDATQVSELLRRSARDIGPPGYDVDSGWGLLSIPAALAAPIPPRDPQEPNEDVRFVSARGLFGAAASPLTTPSRRATTVVARVDPREDPRDLYRVWVAAHRRLVAKATGAVVLSIWGPSTRSVSEKGATLHRDLLAHAGHAVAAKAGARGFWAYLDVSPSGAARDVSYSVALSTH